MPNYDDNHFNDVFANEDDMSTSQSPVSKDTQELEVKPVKLSRGATAGIAIVALVGLFIFLCTLRSCTLEKKVKPNKDAEPSIQVTQIITEPTKNNVETQLKNDENLAVSVEPSSTQAKETTPQISTTNSTIEETIAVESGSQENKGGLQEVVLPAFGEEISSKGIVIGKHSYTYEGSYVYGITISVLIGDDTQSVQYFCPKKTYDALSSTDTVSVSYQTDSGGNVSIISISK